jgi:hypothetical protein
MHMSRSREGERKAIESEIEQLQEKIAKGRGGPSQGHNYFLLAQRLEHVGKYRAAAVAYESAASLEDEKTGNRGKVNEYLRQADNCREQLRKRPGRHWAAIVLAVLGFALFVGSVVMSGFSITGNAIGDSYSEFLPFWSVVSFVAGLIVTYLFLRTRSQ